MMQVIGLDGVTYLRVLRMCRNMYAAFSCLLRRVQPEALASTLHYG